MQSKTTSYFGAIVLTLCSLLFEAATAQTSAGGPTTFKMDSYSLQQPKDWTYKQQAAPGGGILHMFYGKQENEALAYCHTTQEPLNAALALDAVKMTEKQRRDFFVNNSNKDFLFSLHHELASAQGFRLINFRPATLGQTIPSFSADFIFQVPQGFTYRVRSYYTFWPKAQFVTWCQTVSKKESTAENEFLRNLSVFQQFFLSIAISEKA